MLKLSSLAAIAVIGCAILQPASAQTPGAAAAEKSGSAASLNAGTVPLKPSRAASPASFSKSARPHHGHLATAAVAGKRHASARTASASHASTARSGKTSAAMRSKTYAGLRTNRSARSAAIALAFLPARAAPQERARTASARREALHSLPTSAVLPKKPKSG
jgi:hypothetical protein